MIDENTVLIKLKSFGNAADKKGNYLIDLLKWNKEIAIKLIPYFKNILLNKNEDSYLRQVAIRAFLWDFKLLDNDVISCVLDIIANENSDLDLVSYSLTGLGIVYRGTYNDEIISILLEYEKNEFNPISLRCSAIEAVLDIKGFTQMEIYNKINKSITSDPSIDIINLMKDYFLDSNSH